MINKSLFATVSLFTLLVGITFNLISYSSIQANTIKNTPKDINVKSETLIYQGKFHNADKRGSGTASVYETSDGKRILRLTNFSTSSGPDLFVYVYKTDDARSAKELKNVEYISLGRLKSRKGNQEYEIPAGVDLDSFQAISIWCKQFGVNFATAPLANV